MRLNQLKQYIKQTTRQDSDTIIDLILSNSEIIQESGVIDINISDHLPIFLIRKKAKIKHQKVTFMGRSYTNLNTDSLSENLLSYTRNDFATNNIDSCWNIMIHRIYHVVDKLCPLKDFKFAKEKPKWISDDLIELMKNRDKALQQYKRTKSDEDKIEMRKMRNMVNVAVKAARNDYVKTQLDTHQKDPNKFWKNINEILPLKDDGQKFDNILDENKNRISQDKLPDAINTYFATIGKELDKQFEDNNQHVYQYPGILREENNSPG